MQPQTLERATQILIDVVDRGLSYRDAGRRHHVSRSTAEKQMKALVRLAAGQTSIGGLRNAELSSLALLRRSRQEVVKAARAFRPSVDAGERAVAASSSLDAAVRSLRAQSDNANRDVALLLLLLSTGARPLEIALLRVEDYLGADGGPRVHPPWGPPVPGSRPASRIRFIGARLCRALDAYLEERLRRRLGVSGLPAYRGLEPGGALFVTREGRAFEVRARSHTDSRPCCPTLAASCCSILRKAGLPATTTNVVRKCVARRLVEQGATRRQVGAALGISHRSVTRLSRGKAPWTGLVDELVSPK